MAYPCHDLVKLVPTRLPRRSKITLHLRPSSLPELPPFDPLFPNPKTAPFLSLFTFPYPHSRFVFMRLRTLAWGGAANRESCLYAFQNGTASLNFDLTSSLR